MGCVCEPGDNCQCACHGQQQLPVQPTRPNPARRMTTTGAAHPETSHEAARRIWPRTGTQRHAVLLLLYGLYPAGATDEEMQDALEMRDKSQNPRRYELVKDGWVADSGTRRPTHSGSPAVVWVYVPERASR